MLNFYSNPLNEGLDSLNLFLNPFVSVFRNRFIGELAKLVYTVVLDTTALARKSSSLLLPTIILL